MLGADLKRVSAAVAAREFEYASGDPTRIHVADRELSERDGDFSHRLVPLGGKDTHLVGVTAGGLVVQLDARVTPDLEREGLARDLVRLVQQARKDAKLHVSDRIRLRVSADKAVGDAMTAHDGYIREQTLAQELVAGEPEAGMFVAEGEVGDTRARVALTRA